MAKKRIVRLLASEMEILNILWTHGALTIVEVQRQLSKNAGYTTAQTRLNRMVAKSLLKKTSVRPSRYSAAITREQASAADLELLIDQVSEGYVVPLVAQLIESQQLTKDEIEELKSLIQIAERKSRRRPGEPT